MIINVVTKELFYPKRLGRIKIREICNQTSHFVTLKKLFSEYRFVKEKDNDFLLKSSFQKLKPGCLD